jgi:hypothetical protein
MVHLVTLWARPDEGFGDEAGNGNRSATAGAIRPGQRYPEIAFGISVALQDVARVNAIVRGESSDCTKAGNFVPAFIPDNWPPLFGGSTLRLHWEGPFSVPCSGTVHAVAAALIVSGRRRLCNGGSHAD